MATSEAEHQQRVDTTLTLVRQAAVRFADCVLSLGHSSKTTEQLAAEYLAARERHEGACIQQTLARGFE